MTPTEAVHFVALTAAIFPAMRIEDATPDAWWHAGLRSIDLADARHALERIATTQRFASLADILTTVAAIRRDRAERAGDLHPPDADPEDVPAYLAALRQGKRRTTGQLKPRPLRAALEAAFTRPTTQARHSRNGT